MIGKLEGLWPSMEDIPWLLGVGLIHPGERLLDAWVRMYPDVPILEMVAIGARVGR